MPVSRENGLDIYYEVAGAGPPLVLIHALPFDHNLWLYQVERFSARFRTIAMDLRGWGRSHKPHTPFTLADMGTDVLGVLANAGVDGGPMIGAGGGVALDHPQRSPAPFLPDRFQVDPTHHTPAGPVMPPIMNLKVGDPGPTAGGRVGLPTYVRGSA
jgi:pimeloyl-ACP methyl ester carboxylesterase